MGASRKHREEQMEQEFNKYLEELSNAEMSKYLTDMYGIPPLSLPLDDEESEDKDQSS